MEKIKAIFEKYTEMGRTELLFHARRATELLLTHFSPLTRNHDDALSILLAFAAASVGSDGEFTDKETIFCAELLHLSPEHTRDLLTRSATAEKKDAAEHLFDVCEGEIKLLLLDFCMCFVASDDSVSPEESEFIKSLVL